MSEAHRNAPQVSLGMSPAWAIGELDQALWVALEACRKHGRHDVAEHLAQLRRPLDLAARLAKPAAARPPVRRRDLEEVRVT